jgi:hypothetical protein
VKFVKGWADNSFNRVYLNCRNKRIFHRENKNLLRKICWSLAVILLKPGYLLSNYFYTRKVFVRNIHGFDCCFSPYSAAPGFCNGLTKFTVLHDVIPLGYAPEKLPLKQRTIRTGLRARSKKQAAMYEGPTSLDKAPQWIKAAIDAVWKGPSAINEQPVVFTWEGGDAPVKAKLPRVSTGKEYTDLGIAKLHFELAAEACGIDGSWEWGENGAFAWSE